MPPHSGVRAMPTAKHQPEQSRTYRIVTGAFGVLFVVVALIIFVVSEISLRTLIAGGLVGGLGVDAIISALHSKQSLLARLGPLP